MNIRNKYGFTLFELVMVMALIAILALIAIPSIGNPREAQALAERETLKTNLRFTQSKAMSDLPGNIWGLSITSSSYSIQRNGGVPNPPVNLPGSNSETYTLPPGITITSGTGLIRFNFRGQPVDNAGTPLVANYNISVNSALTVTITRETGFIP